jgi:hypothetical protein
MNNQLQQFDDYEQPHASYPDVAQDVKDEQADDNEQSRLLILPNDHAVPPQALALMHLNGLREQKRENTRGQAHWIQVLLFLLTVLCILAIVITGGILLYLTH